MKFASPASCLPVVAAALLLAGCANTAVRVLPPEATIVNSTGKPLRDIRYQACGANAGEWLALPQSTLAAGASIKQVLPASCVDMDAFYADGRLAGSQRGVKQEFPFRWVLY
jgi:hypothetical protein